MKSRIFVVGVIVLLVVMTGGVAMAANQAESVVGGEESSMDSLQVENERVTVESAPQYNKMFETFDKRTLDEITSAQEILLAYFQNLYWACNLPKDNIVPISGTIGSLHAYSDAYSCWGKSWRDEHSYEEFLDSWEGTVNVGLLKLIPAGEENGQKKYFVETRNIEAIQDSGNPRMGVFCYKGYITVGNTQEGWRITDCQLAAEDLSWYIAGHQPWRSLPEEVAQIIGLGIPMGEYIGTRVVEDNEDGSLTVRFQDEKGKDTHLVIVVQTQDQIYQVISSERIDGK